MIDLDAMTHTERLAWLKRGNPRVTKSKYHNKPTEYNGIRYDSKAEAKRAAELDVLTECGRIKWWLPQVKFRLGDAVYITDFLVASNCDIPDVARMHAEDVKGIDTAKFKRDRKLWEKYGPMDLHVIYRDRIEIVKGKA